MEGRVILVSYGDRNKKIAIPDNLEESDIKFLSTECKNLFSFSTNVNLQFTFQMYDLDWECYVDLEDDYIAKSKDKLKLIVTPILMDIPPTPQPSVGVS